VVPVSGVEAPIKRNLAEVVARPKTGELTFSMIVVVFADGYLILVAVIEAQEQVTGHPEFVHLTN